MADKKKTGKTVTVEQIGSPIQPPGQPAGRRWSAWDSTKCTAAAHWKTHLPCVA